MSVHPYTGERTRLNANGGTYEISLVPAVVYSFFDADGNALYVGCTTRGYTRFDGHGAKEWFTESARIEVEHFEDKSDGLKRERELIRQLRPPHNVVSNPDREAELEQSRRHRRKLSPDELAVRREKQKARKAEAEKTRAETREWRAGRYSAAIECSNCGRGKSSSSLLVEKGTAIEDAVCSSCGLKAYRAKEAAA